MAKTLLASSLSLACGLSAGIAHAASFQLIEQSASGQGTSYAGAAAVAEDATTIYFNPAGMTRLSGQQVIVAGHIVAPQAEYTDTGSTNAIGAPLTGTNSSTGEPALVPNFYYMKEMENNVWFGLGVNVPFGLTSEYDDGWIGRYHALKSELTTININPAFAWKATDKLSVGFGLNIQYIDLSLSSNIDSYGACVNTLSAGGDPNPGTSCFNAGLTGLSNAAQDSKVTFEGDSLELGWNAGLMYDINDKNRLGLAYRSAVKHNVGGNSTYDLYAGPNGNSGLKAIADGATAQTGFQILQSVPLKATADLPATLSISYAGEVADKWTALFDWTYTEWSSLSEIVIVQESGVPGQDPKLELNYKNSNRYSVGALYQHNEKLVYRGGIAYDETPIRSPEQTSARIPGNDRTWLSFGAGYAISDDITIDLGYSHLFIDDTEVNNNAGSSSSGATLTGTYESSVDIFSAQAVFKF